jgi:hypothetical protein
VFVGAVGRVILIPFALLLAAVASLFVLVTLGLELLTVAAHQRAAGADTLEAMLGLVHDWLGVAAGLSVIPPLLVVLVGEIARIRSALYYVAGGGAALAAVPLLAQVAQPGNAALSEPAMWQVFATAGFAGGLVYWLLAGRNA